MGRALVIGIDEYRKTPLKGCVADAREMERLLSHNDDGSKNYDVRRITSDEASISGDSFRKALASLFEDASDLLFFYAEHGAQTEWGGRACHSGLRTELTRECLRTPAPPPLCRGTDCRGA